MRNFVTFGDLDIDVDRIVGFNWVYKEGHIENALGLSTTGKTDVLDGVVLFLDTTQTINVKDTATAELIKEWYERNVSPIEILSQSTTDDIL